MSPLIFTVLFLPIFLLFASCNRTDSMQMFGLFNKCKGSSSVKGAQGAPNVRTRSLMVQYDPIRQSTSLLESDYLPPQSNASHGSHLATQYSDKLPTDRAPIPIRTPVRKVRRRRATNRGANMGSVNTKIWDNIENVAQDAIKEVINKATKSDLEIGLQQFLETADAISVEINIDISLVPSR